MKSILFVALILGVLNSAHAETFAEAEEGSSVTSRTSSDVGLFEQCTLVVKQEDEAKGKRQALKLVQNNENAVIYEAEVDNVKLRLIHASGKLAKFKESQTFQFEKEMARYHDDIARDKENLVQSARNFAEYKKVLPAKIKEAEERIASLEKDDLFPKALERERETLKDLKQSLRQHAPSVSEHTPSPQDGDVTAYLQFEVMLDGNSIHSHLITPEDRDVYTDPFLRGKIKNERDLFNSQVQENGRLGWNTSDDGFVGSASAYSVNCNAGI